MNYEITISPNYVNSWGITEAIRELLQNAIDGEKCGYEKEISYGGGTLHIANKGISLLAKDLILGCSSKDEEGNFIGKYGEGFKLALVVLLRKGYKIEINNKDKIWIPSFKVSDKFNTQVLNIEEKDGGDGENLSFDISTINENLYEMLLDYFPCINDNYGKVMNTEKGQILFDKRFKGKMFVEGLYIQTDENFQRGYNFSSDVVELDRDRRAINYYELRALTAASVVTAEECSTEIFDDIAKSYVDVRDIQEVIDEASNSFLEEYRDKFYEKNDLEENTLVATDTVMRQLEQMDIDVPVVEGSEITSYIIAKANDKLGLIEEAQEEAQSKSQRELAFEYLEDSKFLKLKRWIDTYGLFVTQEGKEKFNSILTGLEPTYYWVIKQYVPENCKFTNREIEELKEVLLNDKEEEM